MIEFFHPSLREDFHKLPLWRQQDLMELAEVLAERGKVLRICQIDVISEKILEISVRIDEKFDNSRLSVKPHPVNP